MTEAEIIFTNSSAQDRSKVRLSGWRIPWPPGWVFSFSSVSFAGYLFGRGPLITGIVLRGLAEDCQCLDSTFSRDHGLVEQKSGSISQIQILWDDLKIAV
jgi:hypothetical protein